jgi:hypothetical protein
MHTQLCLHANMRTCVVHRTSKLCTVDRSALTHTHTCQEAHTKTRTHADVPIAASPLSSRRNACNSTGMTGSVAQFRRISAASISYTRIGKRTRSIRKICVHPRAISCCTNLKTHMHIAYAAGHVPIYLHACMHQAYLVPRFTRAIRSCQYLLERVFEREPHLDGEQLEGYPRISCHRVQRQTEGAHGEQLSIGVRQKPEENRGWRRLPQQLQQS